MSSTQPPYYSSTFGEPNQNPSATTATGTQVGSGITSTGQANTGPARTTAGPHQSDLANKADPRVDSDLNNRAQYAPGATTTGNVHPQATQNVSNPQSSTAGPHKSSLLNKLDPRVNSKTGEMSSKSTNATGSGAMREPTDTTGGAAYQQPNQAATAAGGAASSAAGYNTAPVSGSQTTSGVGYQPTQSSGSTYGTQSKSAAAGESVGGGVKSAAAGIHGAGESLRGGLTAAVDKAFGHEEGAAKNSAIAREGEREIQSGNFSRTQR
ncbi:hypothetical protein AtubIFM55763_005854 [Aspergillus tubingensis]|jgi:hypothetical protein|uniref:Uncharacterized protein n=4 Tax=Aspergillus subgen. Circumdati TaxID=2720871 RepID=A0A117E3U6_ASPNG|nr:uncharacterized protein AtWU_09203 [Aspergillus tubingensis]OJZ80710.1 hypothetical protein ASPFODRAFT_52937 [Aspergillus luchuensis CBS 106.47]BCS07727.1 hypothetical protein ALUC_20097S [Aspergillus luchuensis]GAA89676.1 hypothetical protein AKAW_07790 [Aspergillus luchuensis IFO 4308]GAQ46850.1 hypothetical protein AKAW_07790 [Aspergillus niger]GAT20436.1 hypothetical protein RIB2604_00701190 [Aspergillus luchuensis]